MPAIALESRASRVGIDPIEHVFLMENHDQAYHIWRDAGVKEKILVHIDAHHDMWWIDDNRSLTIANFICPAIKEGIVREVYWVVPDRTWDGRAGRSAVWGHLKRILKGYPSAAVLSRERHRLNAELAGTPLSVCSLDALPMFTEDVLLDVDADYLVIPYVSHRRGDRHNDLPWCWPEQLVERLRRCNLRTDLATIAYSVEGGYTPLKWKYLGDEIAFRLGNPRGSDSLERYELIRAAALAESQGDVGCAEDCFRRAGASSAACLHLSYLLVDKDLSEARSCYQRALSLDPSYRTDYGSPGMPKYRGSEYKSAERGFRQTLALDPENALAQLGLGWIALHSKRWIDAEARFQAAIAFSPNLLDAYRGLGKALVKQRRIDEAIGAYEQSLRLALAGSKGLDERIATQPDESRLRDSEHGHIHAVLAKLFEQKRQACRAMAGYRMALECGYGAPWVRFHLARVLLIDGQWVSSAMQASRGLAALASRGRTFLLRMASKVGWTWRLRLA